jgi:porcupine-like protein
MLYLLRALSLQYEYSTGKRKEVLSFLEYNGYMLCPGSILFGPWIPYPVYTKLRVRGAGGPELNLWWLLKTLGTFLGSFLCLAMSSCAVYWLFMGAEDSKWLVASRDAMSVRFSHYFISFASETMCLLCGFYSASDPEFTNAISVTSPLSIEFPRSLVSVVVHWNRPMHSWLKYYVFRPLQEFGPLRAVLYTFLISSALHGLHFPVTMVLLSLGIFTYVEYTAREKLASIYDACIRSRACGPDCGHSSKASAPGVIAANVAFSLVAHFHLACVGIMMDVHDTDADGEPISKLDMMQTQLGRWNRLGFASHWTALVMFAIMQLI